MPLSLIFEDIGAKEVIITIIKQTQECVDWQVDVSLKWQNY